MKVSIIGGLAKECFFDQNVDGEIWGLNGISPDFVKRFDRHFHIHGIDHLKNNCAKAFGKFVEFAKANPTTRFYVHEDWPEDTIPNQHVFPRAELETMPRGHYHCGSFDWLVAYAAHLGAREISLHGIGLAMESGEPLSAWACLEYWCGYAAGMGIKLTTSEDCNLFYYYHVVRSNTRYGFDETYLIEDRSQEAVTEGYPIRRQASESLAGSVGAVPSGELTAYPDR